MTEEEKRALIEEVRADVMRLANRQLADLTAATDAEAAGIHSCHDRCSRPACVMRRERDEARAELDHMRHGYDRLRADRDYHCDRASAAAARAEHAEAQLAALHEAVRSMREKHDAELEEWALAAGGQRNDRLAAERGRDEAVARAERAEAQLAAVTEAAGPHAASEYASDAETRALRIALADAEDAAEAHDRRVRAEALREAAACTVDGLRLWGRKAQGDASEWLRARADEIEEGR